MLIILYGVISNKAQPKYQRMINGNATCGYREYARKFGHIIYMAPQKVSLPWEHVILKPENVIKFINKYPDAIVWAVKHNPQRDKEILTKIANKKIYYSCNAANRGNPYCNVSLIDTTARLKKTTNGKIWVKGKDPDYWKPVANEKEFDYLLIGRRGDKNEIYFLNKLNSVKEKRRILWIGGKEHQRKVSCKHDVVYTKFLPQDKVRDNISRAKVGVLFTELKIEGFPQSFIEMAMCGVPVVYNIRASRNEFYFHKWNHRMCEKHTLIKTAESLLRKHDSIKCRDITVKNCSIERSYERILECLK